MITLSNFPPKEHEWFTKTNDIKWVRKVTPIDDLTQKEELVLYQRWQGNLGSSYWKEIKVDNEPY